MYMPIYQNWVLDSQKSVFDGKKLKRFRTQLLSTELSSTERTLNVGIVNKHYY